MTLERSSYIRAMRRYAEDFADGGDYVDKHKSENMDKAEGNSNDKGYGGLQGKSGEEKPLKDLGPLITQYLGINSYNDPLPSFDFTRDRYNVSSSADLT